jgi:hypothetical protein
VVLSDKSIKSSLVVPFTKNSDPDITSDVLFNNANKQLGTVFYSDQHLQGRSSFKRFCASTVTCFLEPVSFNRFL